VQVRGASGEHVRREAQQAEEEGEAQRAEQQGQRPAPQRLRRPGGREAVPQQERHRDPGQDPRRRVIGQRLERTGDRLVHHHQQRSRDQAPQRAIDRPQHDELCSNRFSSGHKAIMMTRPRLGSHRFRYKAAGKGGLGGEGLGFISPSLRHFGTQKPTGKGHFPHAFTFLVVAEMSRICRAGQYLVCKVDPTFAVRDSSRSATAPGGRVPIRLP